MLYGAVVNILINIILIPKIGAMGAVIGTIVAELVHVAIKRGSLEIIYISENI